MPDIRGLISRRKPLLLYLVEEVSVFSYACFLVVMVVIFALLYSYLTPLGHGIGRNLIPLSEATFLNGIYLSLVTISSLGYSDVHPMGASKAIACIEVFLGVALIGILIAKLASRRLSYHVSRLYSDHVQNRLGELATRFNQMTDEMKRISRVHSEVFQETPTASNHRNKKILISEFRRFSKDLTALCLSFHEHFLGESDHIDYFRSVQSGAVIRAGKSVDGVFYAVNQFIISLSPLAKPEVLSTNERREILTSVTLQREINEFVEQNATDFETKQTFEIVEQSCDNLLNSFAGVPSESLPDQVSWITDNPQLSLEEDNGETSDRG